MGPRKNRARPWRLHSSDGWLWRRLDTAGRGYCIGRHTALGSGPREAHRQRPRVYVGLGLAATWKHPSLVARGADGVSRGADVTIAQVEHQVVSSHGVEAHDTRTRWFVDHVPPTPAAALRAPTRTTGECRDHAHRIPQSSAVMQLAWLLSVGSFAARARESSSGSRAGRRTLPSHKRCSHFIGGSFVAGVSFRADPRSRCRSARGQARPRVYGAGD
jgi:hypothetical protein